MKSSRRLHATEQDEQISLFQWASIAEGQMPELCLLFHIPLGGSRNRIEAARLKAAGVRPGVPDCFLPVPKNGHPGLWLELKVKGGKLSMQQEGWIIALREQGYAVRICYGALEAIREITQYLRGADAQTTT